MLKGKKRNKKYWAFMIPVFAIVIITILNAIFLILIWLFPNNLNQESAAESTFIATGIEIIAIALAVWAGLNIVNAIERKEFDSLNENISDLTKREVTVSLYDRDKEQFCQELLKSREDPLTEYLYKKFSSKDNIKYPFSIFFEIEQLFSQVYFLHKSENKIDNELISKADKGMQLIHSVDSKFYEDPLAKKFLKYRLLEFDFYKGYCEKGAVNRFNCFVTCASGYFDIAPLFDSTLPQFDVNTYKDIPDMINDNNTALTIYMANSIGESCSKILQLKDALICNGEIKVTDDEIKTYGKKAIFYCGCAVKWNGNDIDKMISKREVYYRNYAVAMENYEKHFAKIGDFSTVIIPNYKIAFLLLLNYNETNPNRIGYVYRTLMFYYNKCLDSELYIQNEFNTKEEFNLYLLDLKDIKKDTIEKLRALYELATLSQNDIGLRTYVYCMKGFAIRNIILLKKASNSLVNIYFQENDAYYQKKYKSIIYTIDFMELSDGFSKKLRKFDEIFDIYN